MKVQLNDKTWDKLSPGEQRRLLKTFDEQENRDVMIVLDTYLKIACKLLHNNFGYGEKRLRLFLGGWRREFRAQAKSCRNGTQSAELDAEMRKLFKREGYPDYIFSGIYQDWKIDTNKTEDENK